MQSTCGPLAAPALPRQRAFPLRVQVTWRVSAGADDVPVRAVVRRENQSPPPDARITVVRQAMGMTGQLAEDGMDKAATDRIEQQVRLAFPDGTIARVQVLQYGDDPEVEPGQAAVRAFFDWPGRSDGGQADPKTVHRFVTANAAALGVLGDGLPRVIGWVEFRPEGEARPASAGG